MVGRVVARDLLQRVPRQHVPAVVVDRLDGAADKVGHAEPRAEHGHLVGEPGAERVEHEALDRVVVEGAVGVGDVEAVVAGVPVGWWEGLVSSEVLCLRRVKEGHILYIHLFMCMARCQKYCQVSRKQVATQSWKPGIRTQ